MGELPTSSHCQTWQQLKDVKADCDIPHSHFWTINCIGRSSWLLRWLNNCYIRLQIQMFFQIEAFGKNAASEIQPVSRLWMFPWELNLGVFVAQLPPKLLYDKPRSSQSVLNFGFALTHNPCKPARFELYSRTCKRPTEQRWRRDIYQGAPTKSERQLICSPRR